VALGDQLADVLWRPNSPRLGAVRLSLQRAFGIDTDGFISLALACKQELAEQAQLFDVSLTESLDCQLLLERAREQQLAAALETALEYDSLMAVFGDHKPPDRG
jgi:hypothetical protein